MELIIIGLAEKFPFIVGAFAIMGLLRAVFKPIMGVLRAFVIATPSPADNALLDQAEASSLYKGFAWAMDYVASIKLPGQK